jgi:hypothetical protein
MIVEKKLDSPWRINGGIRCPDSIPNQRADDGHILGLDHSEIHRVIHLGILPS